MVLIMKVTLVWHLGLEPPADVKLPNNTRNKAQKWFAGLKATNFGKDAWKAATEWQNGMVDGCFEWPVWTVQEREEELRARGEKVAAPVAVAATAVVEEVATPA